MMREAQVFERRTFLMLKVYNTLFRRMHVNIGLSRDAH